MADLLSKITDRFRRSSPRRASATGVVSNVKGAQYQSRAAVDLAFVRSAISNPYLQEQIINLLPQIFSGKPAISVHLRDSSDPDPQLTAAYTRLFDELGAYTSMRTTYQDTLLYGASIKSVGYDDVDGVAVITEIRDLPAQSFSTSSIGGGWDATPNPLLPGIGVDRAGNTIVVQTDPITHQQQQIDNFVIITAPGTPQPAGVAYCAPIYPVIAEIDVVTRALQQKVRRTGVPIIFPRVSPDFIGDISTLNTWAKNFLQLWGSQAGYFIPEGIELTDVKIYESQGADERLQTLADLLAKFFNPTTTLDKDGQHILSTTDTGRTAIWHAFLMSQQEWIEAAYERIFKDMLWFNGYGDYDITITLPRPSIDKSEIRLQQLTLGVQNHLITRAEARACLDALDLPPLTPEISAELDALSSAAVGPAPVPSPGAGPQQLWGAQPIQVGNAQESSYAAVADAIVRDVDIPPADQLAPSAQLQADADALVAGMRDISEQVRDAIAAILQRGA